MFLRNVRLCGNILFENPKAHAWAEVYVSWLYTGMPVSHQLLFGIGLPCMTNSMTRSFRKHLCGKSPGRHPLKRQESEVVNKKQLVTRNCPKPAGNCWALGKHRPVQRWTAPDFQLLGMIIFQEQIGCPLAGRALVGILYFQMPCCSCN